LAGAPTLGNPTLGQVHSFSAEPLVTAAPIIAAALLNQVHRLQILGVVTGAPVLGTPLLTRIPYMLNPLSLDVDSTWGTAEIDASASEVVLDASTTDVEV